MTERVPKGEISGLHVSRLDAPPEVVAEAERAHKASRTVTAIIQGDPLPGRSALDRMLAFEPPRPEPPVWIEPAAEPTDPPRRRKYRTKGPRNPTVAPQPTRVYASKTRKKGVGRPRGTKEWMKRRPRPSRPRRPPAGLAH